MLGEQGAYIFVKANAINCKLCCLDYKFGRGINQGLGAISYPGGNGVQKCLFRDISKVLRSELPNHEGSWCCYTLLPLSILGLAFMLTCLYAVPNSFRDFPD